MNNNSCRKCGNGLEINQRCDVCHDVTEFYCHACGNITEKQIHSQCLLISSDQVLKTTQNKK